MPETALRRLLVVAYVLTACATLTAACSSRAIPKRPLEVTTIGPPPLPDDDVSTQTSSRPNITFPTFNCPPTYDAWYCLNDATCFAVEIHNERLYNCECALGFMGPRCEYKEVDGSYLPMRKRVMMEQASIMGGATLALFVVVICCISIYVHYEKQLKQKLHDGVADEDDHIPGHENEGMDTVDGRMPTPIRRPFGPHHTRVLTLEETFQVAARARMPLP